jgi:predicted phosphodiesterase
MKHKITVISDTHGKHSQITRDLPGGDILIHAGDFMNSGYYKTEAVEFFNWFDAIPNYDTKVFIAGNHEHRLQRYLLKKAPELAKLDELQLENFLKLKDLEIDFVSSLQLIKAGKLNILHGHEFGGFVFNPVNPARGLFNRAKTNSLCGHFHQTSSHHENNLNNEGMACFTTGALCQLNPEYRPFAFTKWNIGFAFVEIFTDGYFHVHNKRIIDGRVL